MRSLGCVLVQIQPKCLYRLASSVMVGSLPRSNFSEYRQQQPLRWKLPWEVAPYLSAGLGDIFFGDVDILISPKSLKATARLL